MFVTHGGDCNIHNNDGLTVLHINCKYGGGLVEYFVNKGANINALDNMDQGPIMYALMVRDISLVEVMYILKFRIIF